MNIESLIYIIEHVGRKFLLHIFFFLDIQISHRDATIDWIFFSPFYLAPRWLNYGYCFLLLHHHHHHPSDVCQIFSLESGRTFVMEQDRVKICMSYYYPHYIQDTSKTCLIKICQKKKRKNFRLVDRWRVGTYS